MIDSSLPGVDEEEAEMLKALSLSAAQQALDAKNRQLKKQQARKAQLAKMTPEQRVDYFKLRQMERDASQPRESDSEDYGEDKEIFYMQDEEQGWGKKKPNRV